MEELTFEERERSLQAIIETSRPLERAWAKRLLEGNHEQEIIEALKSYQNEDGGFGHGLEADVRLPASSAIATTIAFQHLCQMDYLPEAQQMLKEGIRYFEESYDAEKHRWYAVPKEVNEHPHAFWWHVHEDGLSWIDHHWGNPAVEIIGYLAYYPQYVKSLPTEQLLEKSLDYLHEKQTFESEHEVYCYLRFFRLHPHLLSTAAEAQLKKAAAQLVRYDRNEWKNYVPMPLKFVPSPKEPNFGIPKEEINKNLDYLAEQLQQQPLLAPTWKWNDYMDVWAKAHQEWSGVLTLEALEYLQNFERVKKMKKE